ncbi:MAG: hypothetical protein OCD02_17770 [Spirochaetaceae bacterium]
MKVFIIVLCFVLLFVLINFIYYGGLKKIVPKEEISGGETLVYNFMKGDYSQSGTVSDQVYWDLINKLNITTYKGAGIYYDNPQNVSKENLRSDIGCILEDDDKDRIEDIEKLYKTKVIENKKYLIVEFQYKGKLSVLIGLLKVYPRLNKLKKSDKQYIMEIWDIPNKKIIYRMNLE